MIQIRIRDPDRHQNLIICSMAHCQPFLETVMQIRWEVFADKHTNNDDYTSSLAQVISQMLFSMAVQLDPI